MSEADNGYRELSIECCRTCDYCEWGYDDWEEYCYIDSSIAVEVSPIGICDKYKKDNNNE
jgi:hypothetical protein